MCCCTATSAGTRFTQRDGEYCRLSVAVSMALNAILATAPQVATRRAPSLTVRPAAQAMASVATA